MIGIFIFLLGLIIGSFLNVLIHRLPRNEDFVWSRSRCPKCGHVLFWQDLVPVFSFLVYGRRCRHCRQAISWRYPAVELLTAFLFAAIFWLNRPLSGFDFLSLSFWLAATSLLIIIVFIDFDYFLILDKILLVLAGLTVIYQFFRLVFIEREVFVLNSSLSLHHSITTAVVAGLTFLMFFLVAKGRGMGLGDVKLVFCLGFLFGFPAIIPVVYTALVAGLIWGLTAILFFGANLKSKLPLGSILGVSAVFFIAFNKILASAIWPYLWRMYL